MKLKLTIALLLLIILSSCSSDGTYNYTFREVGFISTSIANVNNYNVSFSNGMAAKTQRLIIAVNGSPVMLVIENYTGSGYFYLGKSKVNFSLNVADADIDMMGVSKGELHYIETLSVEDQTIKLVDGTNWFVPNEEQADLLDDWLVNPEVIIPDNKPEQGLYFINTATVESVFAIPMNKPTNTNSDE